MGVLFPNESRRYRAARDELLERQIELRREMEAVAAARRALPLGGVLKQGCVFDELDANGAVTEVKLSELLAPGKTSWSFTTTCSLAMSAIFSLSIGNHASNNHTNPTRNRRRPQTT